MENDWDLSIKRSVIRIQKALRVFSFIFLWGEAPQRQAECQDHERPYKLAQEGVQS